MRVTATGPVVNGQALREVSRMTEGIVEAVAQEAFHEVGVVLAASLQNPTGFYESRITVDRTRETAVVHDSNVVYGPWLEGVSSRNQQTRFKGYASFRRATQRTQQKVDQTAQPIVRQSVKRMNG